MLSNKYLNSSKYSRESYGHLCIERFALGPKNWMRSYIEWSNDKHQGIGVYLYSTFCLFLCLFCLCKIDETCSDFGVNLAFRVEQKLGFVWLIL